MEKQIEELKRQLEVLERIRTVCDSAWNGAKRTVVEGGLNIEDLVRYAWADIGGPARKIQREDEAAKEAKRANRVRKPVEEPATAAAGKAKAKTKPKARVKRGKKVVIPAGQYRLPNEEKVYNVNIRGPRAMALVNAASEMGLDEFVRVCRIGD
jgi:hypothetical protein